MINKEIKKPSTLDSSAIELLRSTTNDVDIFYPLYACLQSETKSEYIWKMKNIKNTIKIYSGGEKPLD